MFSSRWTAIAPTLIAVLAIAWLLDTSGQSDRIRSGLSNDSGDPKGLLVHGSSDKNTLGLDEILYVNWIFENRSSSTAKVQVSFAAPGFQNVQLAEPTFSIPAGGLKTLLLLLHPAEGGQFRLAGHYQTDSAAGQTVLGPVEVVTAGRRLTRVMRQAYSVLKDLALPLLLAYLAYLFQKRQKDRDDLVKQHADDREYKVQVRNIQLPRFQEYAEKHYLPIIASIRLLRRDFKPSEPKPELVLYRLAIFLKRMQRLREERGGVFFQDRKAESILQGAWFCFNHHVEERLGLENRDMLLALTRPDEDFASFRAKTGTPVVSHILNDLNTWVDVGADPEKGGFANCLDLARIMKDVLSFETNRPLDQYWYNGSEPSDLLKFEDYAIPTEPHDSYTDLQRDIPDYLRELDGHRAAKTKTSH